MKQVIIGMACALAMSGATMLAQNVPASNTPVAAPATPAPQASAEAPNPFPPANPKNFSADSPSLDEVNGFLKALWGYDTNRIWQVEGIVKTTAPGVAKVVVLVGDKRAPGKTSPLIFFTTPDGKHAIAENVMDFGIKPFAAARKTLQERADGAARGAKSNELLFVEFADLQCDRCKDAQDKMDSLQQDFPQARIVFEDAPAMNHPYAERAALDGVCVRKAKGDAAFFSFAQAVYSKQAGLTPASADATLKTAISAAGADPAAVTACAALPETKATVDATVKLAQDLGATQLPVIAVNGHFISLDSVPYETLKEMIAFQAGQDGITVHLQPTLSTLK
ncbi:MAG TPA: thioredoxin domain-containing protein [Acidobacteriaceae bacterium]|nr:thioredoxin domain-containing protein [Acidobacteriaceae bacterium]